MPMCEKCWRDSYTYDGIADSQTERYAQLVKERDASGNPCTLREQAGDWWDEDLQRDSRMMTPRHGMESARPDQGKPPGDVLPF